MLHLAYAELLESHHISGVEVTEANNSRGSSSGSTAFASSARGHSAGLVAARNVYVGLVKLQPTSELAWALLERFTRRVDGAAAARQVFRLTRRARLSGELGYHLYLAHGLLEWCESTTFAFAHTFARAYTYTPFEALHNVA